MFHGLCALFFFNHQLTFRKQIFSWWPTIVYCVFCVLLVLIVDCVLYFSENKLSGKLNWNLNRIKIWGSTRVRGNKNNSGTKYKKQRETSKKKNDNNSKFIKMHKYHNEWMCNHSAELKLYWVLQKYYDIILNKKCK